MTCCVVGGDEIEAYRKHALFVNFNEMSTCDI